MFTTAVQTVGSDARWASCSFMLTTAVAAPRVFFTRPCEVTEPLAAEAPLLFDFEFLHPSNAVLVDHKAVVEQPLCRFR